MHTRLHADAAADVALLQDVEENDAPVFTPARPPAAPAKSASASRMAVSIGGEPTSGSSGESDQEPLQAPLVVAEQAAAPSNQVCALCSSFCDAWHVICTSNVPPVLKECATPCCDITVSLGLLGW